MVTSDVKWLVAGFCGGLCLADEGSACSIICGFLTHGYLHHSLHDTLQS